MRPAAASLVLALAGVARGDCPDSKASCVLQREATERLLAGDYAAAAERFRASIASEPSARAYLGYAQAVEGLGDLGLAYEMMIAAQRFSADELRATPDDVEASSRAERIKYKLAELTAKVGFVRVQLPAGADPGAVVSIQRNGTEVRDPYTRSIPVVPHQTLVVALRDRRLEVRADVDAGADATLVIPLAAPEPGAPPQLPPQLPVVIAPEIAPAEPPLSFAVGLDAIAAIPNVGNVAWGYGAAVRVERRISTSWALSARTGFLFHPTTHFAEQNIDFTGYEGLALVGFRSSSRSKVHALFELGTVVYDEQASAPAGNNQPALMHDYVHPYPAIAAGLAMRIGHVDLEAAVLYAPAFGADIDLPVRVTFTIGYDLVHQR
jgi:hypothetical protein